MPARFLSASGSRPTWRPSRIPLDLGYGHCLAVQSLGCSPTTITNSFSGITGFFRGGCARTASINRKRADFWEVGRFISAIMSAPLGARFVMTKLPMIGLCSFPATGFCAVGLADLGRLGHTPAHPIQCLEDCLGIHEGFAVSILEQDVGTHI